MDKQAPDSLQGLTAEFQKYLDNSKEFLRLQVFKMTMHMVTAVGKSVMVGILAVLALFFFSVAAAWSLGVWLENIALGFLILGGFYLIVTLIGYRLRNRLDKYMLSHFSRKYFDS